MLQIVALISVKCNLYVQRYVYLSVPASVLLCLHFCSDQLCGIASTEIILHVHTIIVNVTGTTFFSTNVCACSKMEWNNIEMDAP